VKVSSGNTHMWQGVYGMLPLPDGPNRESAFGAQSRPLLDGLACEMH